MDMNGAVGRWSGRGGAERLSRARTEVMVAGGAGTCFGAGEVGSVAVHMEDHVAGYKFDFGSWVSVTVVQELGDGGQGGLGAICLLFA